MTKRSLNLSTMNLSTLTELKKDVELEMKKRKVLEGGDAIRQNLKLLQKQYDDVEQGDGDLRSEKSSDCVLELEHLNLNFKDEILYVVLFKSIDEQWIISTLYSVQLGKMISDAQDWAHQLVNGSCGEWCPQTADVIIDLWIGLLEGGRKENDDEENEEPIILPSKAIFLKAKKQVSYCLGDYDLNLLPKLFTTFENKYYKNK